MPHKDPEVRKAYDAQWYRSNRERVIARNIAWKKAHRDRVNTHTAKPRAKEKARAWKKANAQKRATSQAKYQRNHLEQMNAKSQRRRAKKSNVLHNDFTTAQWQELKNVFKQRCAYCGKKCKRLTMDHVTPISQGGNHTLSNIVPACQSCNSKKHTGPPLIPVQTLLL